MGSIRIRQTLDFDLMEELDRKVFPYDDGLDTVEHTWWLAEARVGDEWVPAGYAAAQLTDEGKNVFLSRAGVLPEFRGGGLQRRLIAVRLRWAKAQGAHAAWTYTHWKNLRSQRSLARCGFVVYTHRTESDMGFLYFKKSLTPGPSR